MKLTVKGGAAVDPDSGSRTLTAILFIILLFCLTWSRMMVLTGFNCGCSGLENCAHVLDQNGKIYSATLGLVDIVRGTNSYYKLQLLEDDVQKRWGASDCIFLIYLYPWSLSVTEMVFMWFSCDFFMSFLLLYWCRYWVFRSWGRVGTTIGGNKLDTFFDKNSAMDNFRSVYEEKTGNSWTSSNFTKYPNKFYPLEIDYGQVCNFFFFFA